MTSIRARRALYVVYATLAVAYLAWRAVGTLNLEHPVYAGVFYVAEVFCILSSLVFYTLVVQRGEPPKPATPEHWPGVDVFICTYNEDLDLLRTTAVAARDMDGEHQTWICDDGRRPAVEELAAAIGVRYLTRPVNDHFKAGNLNHALEASRGELVLVLDADHVPCRSMLTRMAPQFSDPRVALVQLPQVYYNVDSYQHDIDTRRRSLWHEATVFHHLMQPGASRLNASFFVGTGALLRRSALAEVGGFATGSITEDIHTSMRLHAAGYHSVYLDEALGFMLAPDTPLAFAAQRLRWAQGAMQILRTENPLRKRGLSVWQRIAYTNSLAGYLAAWQHLIFYLAPGIFTLTGVSPIAIDPTMGLPIFIGHIALDLVTFKLLAAPHARVFLGECYKTLTVAIYIRASAALASPTGLLFRVTPKGRHTGLPFAILVPAAGLFVFNLTAVGLGLARLWRGDPFPGALLLATFFAGVFSVASALALVHAWDRRGAHEPFAFPVSIPAGEGIEIRRINHHVAYAVVTRPIDPETVVPISLRPLGIDRPVGARVIAIERGAGGATIAKFALDSLSPEERDQLDRYVFNVATPAFLGGFRDAPPTPGLGAPEPGHPALVEFLPVRSGML